MNFDKAVSIFGTKQTLRHDGGHSVPKNKQEIEDIISFIELYK